MDTGVPPTDENAAVPAGTPATTHTNGAVQANGAVKANGARSASPKKSRARAASTPRVHRVATDVAVAPIAVTGLHEPGALDEVVLPEAWALPTIVPAEPDVVPPVPELLPPTLPPQQVPGLDTSPVPAVRVEAPEFSDTDGTDGMPSLARPKKPMRPLRKPMVVTRRRPRVRRVTRVVRHVDTWSVFKVAVVFNLFLYGVCLTAGVLLWQVAQNTGTVDNVERFFENFGWETFQLKGGEIFHNSWIAGLFVVVGLTGLAVLMATMFNLITDLVGGIRVSVLEEEVVAREERGLGWRRLTRRAASPSTALVMPRHVVAEPPEPPSQTV
ncbi:MAG TPA: DUF3566 domain-containing protein [Ilumatobacteraceae bacterium]|nr:DUF3566 domain-containing protein [Ilumatobacteraceae bacterium]HRB02508.1 DUF3566 domain-containing protein [Ilumatobacteraceae bacterium]